MARGQDALRVVDVLEREGDPVERAPMPAGRDLGLGRPRLPTGQVEGGRDEGARLRIVPLDALDQRVHQLERREFPGRQRSGEVGDRQVVEFHGDGVSPSGLSIALTPSTALATLGRIAAVRQGESTMAFMTKDGFRLYHEDTGGNALAIMFLHGAGGTHLSWWQQVPVFGEEYRCITVDQRGFGQSPDVSGGPGPAALGTDAIALLDHLGIARAAIVAQSMGGWAAVGAAVRAPERFWAIALANTVGNLTNPEIAALRQKLAAASPPRPAVLWHGALGATFRKTQPVRTFLYAELAGLNAPRPADFSEQLGRLTTPVEQFAATRVPTMFLTSDEDGLIWPELSKNVHHHVPGSRFERVDACGHSTYLLCPVVFHRELRRVLKD